MTAEFPACDTLINNAGIMRNLNMNDPRALTDVTRELDVNLHGPVQMVQAFLPHLKQKPKALIVNVSSGLAFVPFPLSPVYSAAKAGMHAFTRCLRVHLKGTSVAAVWADGEDGAVGELVRFRKGVVLVRTADPPLRYGMTIRNGISMTTKGCSCILLSSRRDLRFDGLLTCARKHNAAPPVVFPSQRASSLRLIDDWHGGKPFALPSR